MVVDDPLVEPALLRREATTPSPGFPLLVAHGSPDTQPTSVTVLGDDRRPAMCRQTSSSMTRRRRLKPPQVFQKMIDPIRPMPPTIMRMTPTASRLKPSTSTSTANARMAPTASRKRLVPNPIVWAPSVRILTPVDTHADVQIDERQEPHRLYSERAAVEGISRAEGGLYQRSHPGVIPDDRDDISPAWRPAG